LAFAGMMASFQEYRRRTLIPVAGLALIAYFLLFYLPLSRRAKSLEEPLQTAWRKLIVSLDQTNATSIDFLQLTNQLSETRQALTVVETTKREAAARLELSPALQAKLAAPFQLVDYENERSKQMDALERRAKEQKINLDLAVFAGFPEHTADTPEPSLLWPALALTDDLLNTAVRCKVTAIHSLEVPLALTNTSVPDAARHWSEIPIQLEFTATADSAVKLIQSLPLRAQEMGAAGLPDAPQQKAPLFIDRLVIRKQSPEKPDEVRVWLRAVGFILYEP
jgi:hypothetical protein